TIISATMPAVFFKACLLIATPLRTAYRRRCPSRLPVLPRPVSPDQETAPDPPPLLQLCDGCRLCRHTYGFATALTQQPTCLWPGSWRRFLPVCARLPRR